MRELTVCPEEVVEQLEEGEAVPALRGLDLQSGIHVDGIESQEVFCMLHHEVCPPCKRLETQQEGKQTDEQGLQLRNEMTQGRETRKEGIIHTTGAHRVLKGNTTGFVFALCMFMCLKGIIQYFCAYLLSCRELDKKIDTTFISAS